VRVFSQQWQLPPSAIEHERPSRHNLPFILNAASVMDEVPLKKLRLDGNETDASAKAVAEGGNSTDALPAEVSHQRCVVPFSGSC
jgi:hypothetical protein